MDSTAFCRITRLPKWCQQNNSTKSLVIGYSRMASATCIMHKACLCVGHAGSIDLQSRCMPSPYSKAFFGNHLQKEQAQLVLAELPFRAAFYTVCMLFPSRWQSLKPGFHSNAIAFALASIQSWLPLLRTSIPIGSACVCCVKFSRNKRKRCQ